MMTWMVISYFFDDCGFSDFGSWSCAAYTTGRIAIFSASFVELFVWTFSQITDLQGVIFVTNKVFGHGLPYFLYLLPTVFWIIGEVQGEVTTQELDYMFTSFNTLATFTASTHLSNENVQGYTETSRIAIWSFYIIQFVAAETLYFLI